METGRADRLYPLALLSPPEHQFLNSTFVNIPRLRGAAGPTPLLLHPDDAGVRGIVSGDTVRVWNGRGQFSAEAQVTDEVRPGVAVSYGVRWARFATDGHTVNDTTAQLESDMGGGATFYDTAVEVELALEEVVVVDPDEDAAPVPIAPPSLEDPEVAPAWRRVASA